MRFEDRVIIVTGGGNGIGKAYVKAFCKEGGKVVIGEYNDEYGKNTEKEMLDAGYEATFVHCDVSDEEQVKNMIETTVEKYGKIDVLVNNAQATDTRALPTVVEDTTVDIFKLNWNTGAFASFLCTKYAVPYMKEKGYGRIINTASATGVMGMATFAAYGSQKEAVRGLTRVCANELGAFGITCNVICPGAMTDSAKLLKETQPEIYAQAVAGIPLRRMGDADADIAPAVLFLASKEASFITGQTIGVDGGVTVCR